MPAQVDQVDVPDQAPQHLDDRFLVERCGDGGEADTQPQRALAGMLNRRRCSQDCHQPEADQASCLQPVVHEIDRLTHPKMCSMRVSRWATAGGMTSMASCVRTRAR